MRRKILESAHIARDFRLRDPAATADVDGTQFSALHERVHRRATDAEDLRRLLGREEKRFGGHDVPKRLRTIHVDLPRISRALLCSAAVRRWGSGLQKISSYLPRHTHPHADRG
jgi:hypothetical protein